MGIYDNLPSASPATSGVTTFGQAMGPFSNPSGVGAVQVGQISGVQDPLGQLRQRATAMLNDPTRQHIAQQIIAGHPHASGFQGLLQDVMSNPIVKTVMKPLELLDYGRRGVISTVKEVSDLMEGGHASLSDWWKQTNDPTFGFGKILPNAWRKNVWLSRIAGLAGDVALDPLTYVTLGGSEVAKLIGHGAEARILAGARLSEAGIVSAERGAEIARKGIGFLTSEERAALGLGEQGLYFMGKRVAGTGSIAEALQKSAFRMRVFGGETLKMQKIVRMFDGEQVQQVRRALLDGTLPSGEAANFFHAYMANNVRREATAAIGTAEGHLVRSAVEAFSPEELNAARTTAWRAAEGVTTGEPITAAEQRVADVFAEMQTRRIEEINAERLRLDPTGQSNFGVVENHFPHVRTGDAMDYMSNLHNTHAQELRDVLEGPSGYEGMFKSRMAEGDKFFGVELTKKDIEGGVGRLNEIANEAGFKGKFFETDMIKAHSRYIDKYAAQRGENAFLLHLQEKGALLPILDRMIVDPDLLAQGVKDIVRTSENFGKGLEKVRQAIEDTTRKVQQSMGGAIDTLTGAADKLEVRWATQDARLADAVTAHSDALASLDEATTHLRDARAAYDAQLGVEKPQVWHLLNRRIEDIRGAIYDVRERIAANGKLLASDHAALATLSERVSQLSQMEMVLTEHGNRIEQMLTDIVHGNGERAVANLDAKDLYTAAGIPAPSARTSGELGAALRGAHRNAAVVDGNMEAIVRQAATDSPWFATANAIDPIPVKTIANLSVPKVNDIAARAIAGTATTEEMRAATIWMMARAEAIHGGLDNLPVEMRKVLDSFVTGPVGPSLMHGEAFFQRVGDVMRFDKMVAQSDQWAARGMRLDILRTNYKQIENEVTDFASKYIEAKMMSDRIATRLEAFSAETGTPMADLLGMEVPLEQFIQEVGHDSPLSDVFAQWIDQANNENFYRNLMQPDNVSVTGDWVAGMAEGAAEAPPTLTWGEVKRAVDEIQTVAKGRSWTFEAESQHGRQALLGTLEHDESNVLDLSQIRQDFQDVGKNLQIKFHFNKQLQTRIDRALANGDVAGALAHVDERLAGLRATRTALNRKIVDEYGNVALSGVEVAMTRRAAVDAVKGKLGEGMQQLWFHSQIEERWQKTLGLLGQYGLVPTEEHYHNIVNQVAQEMLDSMGAEGQAAFAVNAGLGKIRRTLEATQPSDGMSASVRKALAARADENRQLVSEAIAAGHDLSTADGVRSYIDAELKKIADKNPKAARLLSQHNSQDYANELLQKADEHGGAAMDTAAWKKFNAERQAAGLTKIKSQQMTVNRMRSQVLKLSGDERTAGERALAEAERTLRDLQEAQPMLEARNAGLIAQHEDRLAARKKFIDEELRPWYKQVTGETANNTKVSVMYKRLKEHVAAAGVSGWRESGSADNMLRFIQQLESAVREQTLGRVGAMQFYRRAADPWANLDEILAGVNSRVMLPRDYAARLLDHANTLESTLSRHEKFLLERQAAELKATTLEGEATIAAARQKALESGQGVTEELFGTNLEAAQAAAKQWAYVHNASVHPAYLQADQIRRENDLLHVLAGYDASGGISIGSTNTIEQQVHEAVGRGEHIVAVAMPPKGELSIGERMYLDNPLQWKTATPVDAQWLAENGSQMHQYKFFTSANEAQSAADAASSASGDLARYQQKYKYLHAKYASAINPQERELYRTQLETVVRDAKAAQEAASQGLAPMADIVSPLAIDGSPVEFTPQEYDSLFRSPSEKVNAKERAALGNDYRRLSAERDAYAQQIDETARRIDERHAAAASDEEKKLRQWLTEAKKGHREGEIYQRIYNDPMQSGQHIPHGWTPARQEQLGRNIDQAEQRLSDLVAERESYRIGQHKVVGRMRERLAQMDKTLAETKYKYEILLADTGKEARRKMRLVAAKVAEPDSGITLDTLRSSLDQRYSAAADAADRRTMIQTELWDNTPHKKAYDRVKEVQAKAEYKMVEAQQNDARIVAEQARRARDAVQAAEARRVRTVTGFQAVVGEGHKRAGEKVGAYIEGVNDVMGRAVSDAGKAADLLTATSPAPTWGAEISRLMHGTEGGQPLADLAGGSPEAIAAVQNYPQELRDVAAHIMAAPAGSGKLVEVDPKLLEAIPQHLDIAESAYKQMIETAIDHERTAAILNPRVPQMKEAMALLEKELAATTADWTESNALAKAALAVEEGKAKTEVQSALKTFQKAASKLDAMRSVSEKLWAGTSPEQLRTNIERAKEAIAALEVSRETMMGGRQAVKDAASAVTREKGVPIATTVEGLGSAEHLAAMAGAHIEQLQQLVKDAGAALESIGKGDIALADKLWVTHYDQLFELTNQHHELQALLDALPKAGEFNAQWMKTVSGVIDGWTSLGSIRLPNSQMSGELWKALYNIKKAQGAGREIMGFLKPYTQFFKTYSTLSPGFHLRNGMSNVMQYLSAGGNPIWLKRSFGLARNFLEHEAAGTLDLFYQGMSEADRAVFDAVLKATRAAGGGRLTDQLRHLEMIGNKEASVLGQGGKLINNAATRLSRDFGHNVEFVGRFSLAYDTIVGGLKSAAANGVTMVPEDLWQTAAARVKRYLFDYTNPSHIDNQIREIVPFWTWMSRNIPTQMSNQWAMPRAYAIYNNIVRNIGLDQSHSVVPQWLQEQGGIRIAGDTYLTPDWGMTRADQVLSELGDPARMGSYINPLLRVPIELLGSRRLYNNQQFSSTPQEVTGGPAQPLIEQLLGLIGATKQTGPHGVRDKNGKQLIAPNQTVTSDKWNYALLNLLPMLSQAERLAPATEGYKAKQGASWLSYLGVPVREVTQQQKDAEIAQRTKQLQQLASNAKKLGYTP